MLLCIFTHLCQFCNFNVYFIEDYKFQCSREMRISKNAITQCAKGQEGNQLLKYYGEESRIANFEYVPYVLINGLEWKGTDLMHDVCAAFHDPPGVCFDNKNAIDGGYFVQRTGYFD